uniref:Uncharacterized protein n=1 Tax=Siphoviridae sp. ct96x5 TaxID=2825367 RepID=A0A8S5PRE7_9CAUD|nr:MAG TPA: hypothetical protein [Siphoviridae sp. ct96x5]
MNWYKVVGVMDDGARIYCEKVIVATDDPSEAVERAKKALCRCADEVFHVTKCSQLNQNKVYALYSGRTIPIQDQVVKG